jgi:hypothetical protein
MPTKYKFDVEKVKTKFNITIGKGDLEIVRYIVTKTDWCGETINTLDYDEPLNHKFSGEGESIKITLDDGRKYDMPLYGWLASFEYHKKSGDIKDFREKVKTKLSMIKKNGGFCDIICRRF